VKKVLVVKSSEVEVKAFVLDDFIQGKETHNTMKKVTKKVLKNLADDLGLAYDDVQISFTKKLMTAYLKEIE